jgi:hypothetical protein
VNINPPLLHPRENANTARWCFCCVSFYFLVLLSNNHFTKYTDCHESEGVILKYGLAALGVVIVVILAWFFALPTLAANELQQALKSGDTIGINKTVDFVSLRENLRGTLGGALTQANPNEPSSMIGSALSGLLLNPLVDQLVTPAGLSLLFQGGMGSFSGLGTTNFRVSSGLQSLDRFAIVLTDLSNPQNTITLVLMPRGMQWKLVGIVFSPTAKG